MINPCNILISGASSGIGRELAIIYAKKGINLFLCGRNQERLQEVKKICVETGCNVLVKSLDIAEEKAVLSFVEEIEVNYSIDLVIANAGISGGESGSEENFDQINRIITTNINGVINLINPVIEKMKQRKKGQVAIISSLASFSGIPSSPAYSASKAAVRIYGEVLRGNLHDYGIEVNVISPGYVETEMTKKNSFYMPFLLKSQEAAKIIKDNLKRNKSRIVFPLPLYFFIRLIGILPRSIIDFFFIRIARKNHRTI